MQDNLSTSSFKDVFKFLIKILFFIVMLFVAILIIGRKYSDASTENVINGYNKQRFEQFYAQEKNSLDMVFIGSSHSYCTFDPEIFDNSIGINSFQMGMPLQHPDSTYYTLKEIFNHQKPKVVVMEVYWDLLENDFELNQAKTLFQVLENEELISEYIKNDFPLSENLKYKIDLLKYQEDYFAFEGNELDKKIQYKFGVKKEARQKQEGVEEYKDKGFIYSNYKMLEDEFDKTNQFKNLDGSDFEISEIQEEFLLKIIQLCNENNAQLVFVTAPVANISMDYIQNYDEINSKILQIANENNIPYIDYNTLNGIDFDLTNDNFRDDAHLNYSGAEIISNHFIEYLKENGII